MTKRNQEIDVDAGAEFSTAVAFHAANVISEFIKAFEGLPENSPLQRLIDSGIIVAAEGAISWRSGHLEHVARVYAADQGLAWRDYGDDLTVALSADGGMFAALVDKARGETE